MADLFADRIRRDAGELSLSDLELAPLWQFCIDEEGEAGQDECVVRPVLTTAAIDPASTDGIVVCDYSGPSGRSWAGMMSLRSEFDGPWCCEATLVLPVLVGALVEHPNLKEYSKVLNKDSPRICLALPWPHLEDTERVRVLIDLAYRALRAEAAEVFPLTCRPRVPVTGWPAECVIRGFLMPTDQGGRVFEAVL